MLQESSNSGSLQFSTSTQDGNFVCPSTRNSFFTAYPAGAPWLSSRSTVGNHNKQGFMALEEAVTYKGVTTRLWQRFDLNYDVSTPSSHHNYPLPQPTLANHNLTIDMHAWPSPSLQWDQASQPRLLDALHPDMSPRRHLCLWQPYLHPCLHGQHRLPGRS